MSKNAAIGRQKVIEAAATMLAMHGLRGISIREVTKFAQAPLGSTYHNFPNGKVQIVTEAIRWAGHQASEQLKHCLAENAHDGVTLFLAQWRQRLTQSNFRFGCPIVAAAIEAPLEVEDEAEAIKSAVTEVFATWQQLLTEYLLANGHTLQKANIYAVTIIAAIEGAVVLCRGQKSIEPFDAIMQTLPNFIAI